MDGLRMLHHHSPDTFTTPVLAERFKISPEAVRRILKSKWVPDKERKEELRARDEARKAERRRRRVEKEWTEGVDKGMLKYKRPESDLNDKLQLT
jgi:Neugrin